MVKVYQCPACGANMKFNSEKQKLVCEYCQEERTVQEMENEQEDKHAEAEDVQFKMYQCPACGAEILTDEYTAATFCNYCGNAALIESRLKNEAAPSRIVPFKITKEQAKKAFFHWCKKGLLTPGDFVKSSTIEKISGMYVPFWMYDYDAKVVLHAECTRTRTERRGDTEYIHTDHFKVFRDVQSDFVHIPVDASKKMDDEVMDKLEPFSYQEMTEFKMPYLSGFLAERYNYNSDELKNRIEERVHTYAVDTAKETIKGYGSVVIQQENTQLKQTKDEYIMLPVWMLNYRYQGKNYLFAMNGQSGKVVGELPVSKGKMAAWFGGIFAASMVVFQILSLLF